MIDDACAKMQKILVDFKNTATRADNPNFLWFFLSPCGLWGAGGLGNFVICGVFLSYCGFICCMLILCYSQFQGGKCSDMASLNVNSPFKFLCWFGYT